MKLLLKLRFPPFGYILPQAIWDILLRAFVFHASQRLLNCFPFQFWWRLFQKHDVCKQLDFLYKSIKMRNNTVVSNHVNSDHVPSFSCLDVWITWQTTSGVYVITVTTSAFHSRRCVILYVIVIWKHQGNGWINTCVRYPSICLISEKYKGRSFSFHDTDSMQQQIKKES